MNEHQLLNRLGQVEHHKGLLVRRLALAIAKHDRAAIANLESQIARLAREREAIQIQLEAIW